MGKKCKKEAEKLGILNLPKYTFYGRPKGLKMKFSKYKPKFANEIRNWLLTFDPATTESESGGGRNNTFMMLAPQAGIYIEIADKMAGYAVPNPGNHVFEMNIHTDKMDVVKEIVKIVNSRWEDGIVPHLDVKKIEKKFKVNGTEVINAWNQFLS
ncbi:MAG: hypothetical protein JW891_12635 [Candidatus Lokiarchaeota archaeon]|nr:hypothetical protein [Candidatus Lokiarchaeota archaeon]